MATSASGSLCRASDSQLVIIDIQEKLGNIMPDKVLKRVIEHTLLLIDSARLLDIPIVATSQYPRGLGGLHPEILASLPEAAPVLEKTCFSCCGASGFDQGIEACGRDQIILTGMESHICVLQTALELHAKGKQVFVIADAVCSRRLENYHNALERMQQAGIIIASAESIIFEWLRDASHARFKDISRLLR